MIDNLIKKINIFDFDGTLFDTPMPDEGHEAYYRATGSRWPFKGWWGRRESLEKPFKIKTGPAFKDFIEAMLRSDEIIVLMTGRPGHCANRIQEIMGEHGLNADLYFFNRGGSSTLDGKFKQIDELLSKFTSVSCVEMWEDRKNHAEQFMKLGEIHPHVRFIINHVGP